MRQLKHICTIILMLISAVGVSATSPALIPLPVSYSPKGEKIFRFPYKTTIGVEAPMPLSDSVRKMFAIVIPELSAATGVNISIVSGNPTLKFQYNDKLPIEGYRLEIGQKRLTLEASTAAGFFYGIQTLLQLSEGSVTRPASIATAVIEDAPRFGWRGFMLDEGRHFFGVDEVKKILDLMSRYKMNRFHWHLTEDQGWRIEIKKYPKLTEVGGRRGSTTLAWKNDPDTIPYEGWYTQDQIREIVDYAADRYIEIIPEVDIPGHTQAAVASYPELLACDPENPHEVWLRQGVSQDVMNVATPAAVEMAKDIVDELIDLFPFGYLHLGGDECPTKKWEQNEQCRKRLAELGSDNFRDLQLDFYQQINDHLSQRSDSVARYLVFWNEVLEGNKSMLPSNAVIMAWIGADKAAQRAAESGFRTILTPQIPYYINRKQSELPEEPHSQGDGKDNLERVYGYQPLRNVADSLQSRYMGVQANFWSEWVVEPEHLEHLMMPRLAAVAEAGWTDQSHRDYRDFLQRIRSQEPWLKKTGWNYAPYEFRTEE